MPVELRKRILIVPKKEISESVLNPKWSLAEKKKLLSGLRKISPEDVDQIQTQYLPHRTAKEIRWFIQRMKAKGKCKAPPLSRPKVPIELWLEMSEDLTFHDVDFSYVLSEVFKRIKEEEEHDSKVESDDPNWNLVYSYMTSLLKGEDTPELGQIEAAVMLDLMEGLAKHLKSLETTEQRQLMAKKYELLASRVNSRNKEEYLERTNEALDDDLLKKTANCVVSHQNGPTTNQMTTSSLVEQNGGLSDAVDVSTNQNPSTSSSANQIPSTLSSANQIPSTSSSANQNPSTLSSANQIPSTSSSANQNPSISSSANQIPSTSSTNQTRHLGESSNRKSEGEGAIKSRSFRRGVVVGRRSKKNETLNSSILLLSKHQKPSLYSINPFCVPVNQLNPRVKTTQTPVVDVVDQQKKKTMTTSTSTAQTKKET